MKSCGVDAYTKAHRHMLPEILDATLARRPTNLPRTSGNRNWPVTDVRPYTADEDSDSSDRRHQTL